MRIHEGRCQLGHTGLEHEASHGLFGAPQVSGGEEPSGRQFRTGVGDPGARVGELPVGEVLDRGEQVGVDGAWNVHHTVLCVGVALVSGERGVPGGGHFRRTVGAVLWTTGVVASQSTAPSIDGTIQRDAPP